MVTTSLIQPRPSPKMDVIFDALEKGWASSSRNNPYADFFILWGLIGSNKQIIQANTGHFAFCDMPYFGRWLPGQDLENSIWRLCYNGVHNNSKLDVSIERFENFGIRVAPWQTETEHILICPSSDAMTMHMHGMSAGEWSATVKKTLVGYTNRPIRVRQKPRKNGTSGPSVADVPIEEDLKGCHALVTAGSLTAIDALLAGVPVYTTAPKFCPAAWVANTNIALINTPTLFDREQLLANLAWKQFSIEEMRNGFCYENFTRLQYNQVW